MPWLEKLLYAIPPLRFIPLLLERVRQEQFTIILITPGRRSAPRYTEMTQILASQPWTIPQFWALSQEAGAIGVLPILGQLLQAWLLYGTG